MAGQANVQSAPDGGRSRFSELALGVLAAALAALVLTQTALAKAIVVQTWTYKVPAQSNPEVDELKAQYRRPAFVPFPEDNAFTPEKAALGKKLYFDPRLSATTTLSCASCHNPGFGWGDGLSVRAVQSKQRLSRRSPAIINAAWGLVFMWDGRAPSLEEQALGPIQSKVEMDLPIEAVLDRIASIPDYGPLFNTAFPGKALSTQSLTQAIATYERTIVSGWAPFDAWVEGDETAISEEAKRGFMLFNGKAGCASCHLGWNFTDDSFHDIGLSSPDIGRGAQLPSIVKMQHAFKTPGLREIASRPPYMHDGSLATLAEVIDHYSHGGIERPSRSDLIVPLELSEAEKTDLVEFLKSLSGPVSPTAMPVLPR